jgi:hypothetical protein
LKCAGSIRFSWFNWFSRRDKKSCRCLCAFSGAPLQPPAPGPAKLRPPSSGNSSPTEASHRSGRLARQPGDLSLNWRCYARPPDVTAANQNRPPAPTAAAVRERAAAAETARPGPPGSRSHGVRRTIPGTRFCGPPNLDRAMVQQKPGDWAPGQGADQSWPSAETLTTELEAIRATPPSPGSSAPLPPDGCSQPDRQAG